MAPSPQSMRHERAGLARLHRAAAGLVDEGARVKTTRIGPEPFIAADHAGTGELVLFLHGIGGNRTNWREQIAALSDRYLTVACDARGWGLSDDYEGPLNIDDMAA